MLIWRDSVSFQVESIAELDSGVCAFVLLLHGEIGLDRILDDRGGAEYDCLEDVQARFAEPQRNRYFIEVLSPVPGIGNRLYDERLLSTTGFPNEYDACITSFALKSLFDPDYFGNVDALIKKTGYLSLYLGVVEPDNRLPFDRWFVARLMGTVLPASYYSEDSGKGRGREWLTLRKGEGASSGVGKMEGELVCGVRFVVVAGSEEAMTLSADAFLEHLRLKTRSVSVWGLSEFGIWSAAWLIVHGFSVSLFDRDIRRTALGAVAQPEMGLLDDYVIVGTSDSSVRNTIMKWSSESVVIEEGEAV